MRGERRLLRIGEYLIARACRHLPAGARDERYREWVAELPAILRDPGVRPAARRAARMLRYAAGTIRGTALTAGSARRVMAHTAGAAAPFITTGVAAYLWGWAKTPQEWIGLGIGCLLGSLTISGCRLAYRWKRGKGRESGRGTCQPPLVLKRSSVHVPVAQLITSDRRQRLGFGHGPAQGAVFVQVAEHLEADGLVQATDADRLACRPFSRP